MDWIREFSESKYTASFQRRCGVVSVGRIVVDNNNLQDGVSKFDATRVNGVKNGCHHSNGIKTRSIKSLGDGDVQLASQGLNGVDRKICNSKLLSSSDGVQYFILNKPLYFLFRLGALMGNEEFFLGFFPFFLWNVDSVIGRQSVLLWCMTMYAGQVAKDVIRWPRPSSPPVIRLETEHSGEHGMPSTHAMAGTIIPCSLFTLIHDRYEVSPYLCVTLAVTWTLVVCLSRLYLGVHSVSDVVCGSGASLLMLASMLPYVGKCDWYLQTHISAPFVALVVGVALCTVLYPSSKDQSSQSNATQVVASTTGGQIGAWIVHNIGMVRVAQSPSGPFQILSPSLDWLAMSVLRWGIGVVLMAVSYVGIGKLSAWALSRMVGLEKTDKRHPSIYITYKFVLFFTVGLMAFATIPMLHKYLGISRPGFLREVL